MFKKGDRVICIDSNGAEYLFVNKSYFVYDVVDSEYLSVDGGLYMTRRFILDVKYQRKQKLDKLC